MSLLERNILIAMGLIAAVTLEVGCGSSQRQNRAALNRAARSATAVTNGVPNKTGAGATSLDGMTKSETEVQNLAKTSLQQDDLPEGTYTLKAVTSYYHYLKTSKNFDFRAGHGSKVEKTAQGYTMPDVSNGTAVGQMDKDNTDSGRKLDIPTIFKVKKDDHGRWTPKRAEAGSGNENILLVNQIVNNKLTDHFDTAADIKASVMNILASGSLSSKDENGIQVTVKLGRIDTQHFQVWVSFDEALDKTDAKTTNSNEKVITRNIYLNYELSATTTQDDPEKADESKKTPEVDPGTKQEIPPGAGAPEASPTNTPPPAATTPAAETSAAGGAAAGADATKEEAPPQAPAQ